MKVAVLAIGRDRRSAVTGGLEERKALDKVPFVRANVNSEQLALRKRQKSVCSP